ncbi:hypothetical protein BH09GEM1_BH09GEM1_31970 [soil metagenome]
MGLLLLLACPVQRLDAQRSAAVAGTVRDSAGHAIAGAEVAVSGTGSRSLTDDLGEYRIVGLSPGPATISARRLGFQSFERATELAASRVQTVDIELVASAELLQPMRAVAPREVYDARLAGFNARSQQKVGHFVTRERIERANTTSLSDMLREIPGVRIGASRNEGRAIRLRGATCPPLVFMDGFPAAAGEFDVDMVDLQSVEGIEVYSGLGSIPPEFSGVRDLSRCGVIAIWSAPSRPRRRAITAGDVRGPPVMRLTESDEIRTRDQVDEAARLDPGGAGPHYPDSLFSARVAGKVVVEFVVDTTGMVAPATIDFLAASHPLFASAVRTSLEGAHFTPAISGGRKVRQYVQLPYTFAVTDSLPPR